MMAQHPSLFKKHQLTAELACLCLALLLTIVRSSDDWIKVKKTTPDPVFLTVGQTLKLQLDIENLNVERWNTTAFWVYLENSNKREHELFWVRQLGSTNEIYYSYNATHISRERQVDFIMKGVIIADSGIYRCKFRKPPHGWSIIVEYRVIVEDLEQDIPKTVYLAKGDTLKLQLYPPENDTNSYHQSYAIIWEFSTSLASKSNEAVRIISTTKGFVERFDTRASLGDNGTSLILKNTTFNDSGVYHVRMMETVSNTTSHKDFKVIIAEKPIANMQCSRIVHLKAGENFFCLCEDISTSEITAKASWFQNGQTIKHARRSHEEELYLKNVTTKDAGLYTCRVQTLTNVVEVTLQILVFSAPEEEMKIEKHAIKHPGWHYLGGCLGIGILLGIFLVLMIIIIRRKCRKSKDVYMPTSPDIEMDETSEYQDPDASVYQEPESPSMYEIPVVTCPTYMDMNEENRRNNVENLTRCSHGGISGYTELDYRGRADSHLYEGLVHI